MTGVEWRTSSECSANNGCVELHATARHVLVRDGKDRDGSAVLAFDRSEFAAFIDRAKGTP